MVVLDLLRAELKSLLAFKEEYENELKSDMRRKKTHLEVQNDELKRNIKEMVNTAFKGFNVISPSQLKSTKGIQPLL